jgi:beta-phosphoglucomutase family hydrolase
MRRESLFDRRDGVALSPPDPPWSLPLIPGIRPSRPVSIAARTNTLPGAGVTPSDARSPSRRKRASIGRVLETPQRKPTAPFRGGARQPLTQGNRALVRSGPTTLGLPAGVQTCLFDLDGVLTQTAKLHAAAWKQMFDHFLRQRAARTNTRFKPFELKADYDRYLDGKPRYDGVRSFLTSRGIKIPEGQPSDPPGTETVTGLGNLKNEMVLKLIREKGVETYEGSIRYVKAAREQGFPCAVVSSSTNCREVLRSAGIQNLFDVMIDGIAARRFRLKGKPAPDTYLAAARRLHARPERAAVYEDALAGVEAGRAGRFGFVVGVDRVGQAEALRRHGADIVVSDLAELVDPA